MTSVDSSGWVAPRGVTIPIPILVGAPAMSLSNARKERSKKHRRQGQGSDEKLGEMGNTH